MSAAATAFYSAFRYVRKNRWTWYVGGALLCVVLGAWLFSAKGQEIKSAWKRAVKTESAKAEVVLSNANILVVATGGKTEIVLDSNGVPNRITNEGGQLKVQAVIDMTRSSSGSLARTEETSSSYQFSGRASSWEWGARAGAEWGRDGWSVPVRIEKRLIGGIGAEASANVPIEGDEKLRRTRLGLALGARW